MAFLDAGHISSSTRISQEEKEQKSLGDQIKLATEALAELKKSMQIDPELSEAKKDSNSEYRDALFPEEPQ